MSPNQIAQQAAVQNFSADCALIFSTLTIAIAAALKDECKIREAIGNARNGLDIAQRSYFEASKLTQDLVGDDTLNSCVHQFPKFATHLVRRCVLCGEIAGAQP